MTFSAVSTEDAVSLMDDLREPALELAEGADVVLPEWLVLVVVDQAIDPAHGLLEGQDRTSLIVQASSNLDLAPIFAGEPGLDVEDDSLEVVVGDVVVGEEIAKETIADDVGQAPAIGDDTFAARVDRISRTSEGWGEEGRVLERRGVSDIERHPVGEMTAPVELLAGPVDEEQVEVLDVEDNRDDPQRIEAARGLPDLAASFAEQEVDQVEQEARLGAAPGHAVDVEVAAVLAQEVVQVDTARAGQPGASVLHDAEPRVPSLVDLVGGVGDRCFGRAAKEDCGPFRRWARGWPGRCGGSSPRRK